eukprot:10924848-Ditylum_brightwellii.AAC.1
MTLGLYLNVGDEIVLDEYSSVCQSKYGRALIFCNHTKSTKKYSTSAEYHQDNCSSDSDTEVDIEEPDESLSKTKNLILDMVKPYFGSDGTGVTHVFHQVACEKLQ